MKIITILSVFLVTTQLFAQEDDTGIRDNSFLIEEAYNQGPGEAQYIANLQSFLENDDEGTDWMFALTHEASIYKQDWQWAYSIETVDEELDDAALHIRWQFVNKSKIAAAARLSGSFNRTFESALAFSFHPARKWVFHANTSSGKTYALSTDINSNEYEYDTQVYKHGASGIYVLDPRIHLMLEYLYEIETVELVNSTDDIKSYSAMLNPGFRHAINLPSKSQLVWGIGVPVDLVDIRSEAQLFFYLSFEH